MRILVDFQDTVGGAPRSLKEHALLLQENGHEIVAVISEKKCDPFFSNTGFEINHLPRFYTRYISRSIRLIFKYHKLIKQKKIDLIYSNRVEQCQFLSIVSDISNVPILNARAGGTDISDLVRIQKDKHYIVYSDENLIRFKDLGFNNNQLFLLRNRIPIPTSHNQEKIVNNNEVVITLIGTIKEETICGLLWFLRFIEVNAKHSDIQYKVYLAGGNRLKTERDVIRFEEALYKTQSKIPENWSITHLGWVDNITQLQSQSQICIGKGRSVVQPAMIGKITFVISESGTLYRCKKDSYSNLQFFNFSGRGTIREIRSSLSEFKELISDRNSMEMYHEEAKKMILKFKEDYATDYAKEKLEEIIKYVKDNQKIKFRYYMAIKKLAQIYSYTTFNKIKKKSN